MTNPRNRDRMQQAAHVTPAAQLPGVPTVHTGNVELDQALRIIKQHLDVRTNSTGNRFERWITLRELHDLGITGGRIRSSYPEDAAALPVWTRRGHYEMLSLAALVGLVEKTAAAAPSTEAPTISSDEIEDLRRRINAIPASITPAQLQRELQSLAVTLPLRMREQFTSELVQLRGRIAALEAAAAPATSTGGGGAAAAGNQVFSVEINLGQRPRYSFVEEFDADVFEGAVIRMQADPGERGDELEMDSFVVAARCHIEGRVTAYITAQPGPVCGVRNFFFQVG